MKLILRKRTA